MERAYIAVIRNRAAPAATKMPLIARLSPVCGEPLEDFGAVVVVALVVVVVVVVVFLVVVVVFLSLSALSSTVVVFLSLSALSSIVVV